MSSSLAAVTRHSKRIQLRSVSAFVKDALLRAYSTHKATTGIVGLPLKEAARAELSGKVDDVLRALDVHGIPKSAAYRKAVEEKCGGLMVGLKSAQSDGDLERAFGRQLEEEIKLCEDELGLIPKMAEWKPWVGGGVIRVVEDGSGEQVAAEAADEATEK